MAWDTVFLYLAILSVGKAESVQVSYSTSYPAYSGEYYIVDGEQLTLECLYTGTVTSVDWQVLNGDTAVRIYSRSPDSEAVIDDTVYKSRIDEEESSFKSSSHQLVFKVNKQQDAQQVFQCRVITLQYQFGSEEEKQLGEILAHPTSISLDGLGVVMEGIQQIIDCEVNSVYKGQDVTEFSVKVGDSKLTSGTKSQTTGSLSGTYNVKYTQRATFTYSQHQGQQVQCEVIWMDETSVKTVITSATFILDVYVKAAAATLQLSASSAVEGSSVTFTCSTSSHPSPRLRLYRQREGQVTSSIWTHNGLSLSWDYTVQSEDNNAEFNCRVDDNQNIQGWDFDVQSEKQKLTVWYTASSVTISGNGNPNPNLGDQRVMMCTADANPEAVITLYRREGRDTVQVGNSARNSLSLTITMTKEINKDLFYCTATSSNTELLIYSKDSDTKYYTVLFSASTVSMTQSPSGPVSENTELTFTCVTDEAEPTADVMWSVDGNTRSSDSDSTEDGMYNTQKRRSVLTVRVDKTLNNKEVECYVSGNTQATDSIMLDVRFSATSLSLETSTSGIVSEDTNVVLTCTTSESNPTAVVLWTRDGTTISADVSDINAESGNYDALKTISTLRVTATRELNGVVYRCAVQGISLNENHVMMIIFNATTIELTPSHTGLIAENVDITLTCVTDESNPTANIVWSRDGEMVNNEISVSEVSGQYNVKKRRSVLTLTTEKSLNGVQYKCHVKRQDDVSDQTVVQVKYPPEVSVQTASNTVEEDSQLVVTCDVEAGNPESLTNLFWEFEPKYPGTQSQSLPGQRENRELRIERPVYSDAGTYRCTAGNTVGSDTGEIRIAIHYPPQLVSSDSLIFYSGLGQQISLNITVRAFPEFSDPESAFTWTTNSGSQITDVVTSRKQSDEIFYSELLISSVKGVDYTSYTVTTDNGVQEPVIFTVDLRQRGPTEAPRDVTVVAVAAEKANITWIVGLSGGFSQTFRILIKEKDKIVDQKFYDTGHQNPENGSLEYFIIPDLSPKTVYDIVVRSMNDYNEGSHTDSNTTTLISRAKPIVMADDLAVEYTDSIATLTWKYEVTDPEITQVVIEQCILGGACTVYNVTENTQKTLEVPASNGEIFYLVIYQDGLEAYRSERFAVVTPPPDIIDEDKTVPVVVSVIVVIVLIGTIVLFVLYRKYKHKFKRNRKYEAEDGQSPPEHLYINETFHTSNYMELDRNDMNNKPTEYQVVNTGAGVTSNEIGIYEDIRKSRRLTMHYDKDLTLGDLIKKGRYSLLHKGFLQMKGQQIAVMIKSINEEIRVSEAQYIFNQVSCLEQIPSHHGIIELFSFGITAPLNVKVVTRYCTNGDLRNFLQQEFKRDNFQCIQDKETFLKQLIFEILQGLSYLENQSHEILHYQLSSEHVLVDEKKSCRLTGFGFREHVLQREIREEDEGIYGAIQWKAPEVIEDCKAHSKASDIWSFGILLHEIFFLGSMPYDGMIEEDIKAFVKEGNTLEKISSCPINVYQMMRKCWTYNPEKRSSFTSMLRQCQIPKKPDLGGVKNQESPAYENVSTIQHFPEETHYENARV